METQLGDFLKRNCPTEFQLIQKIRKDRYWVTADVIESIAYHSDNPAFQTVEFRQVLGDFRKYRLRTPNPARFDLDKEIAEIKRRLQIDE